MDVKIDEFTKIAFYTLDGVYGLPSIDAFSMEILLLLSFHKCKRVSVHKVRFTLSAEKLPYLVVDDTTIVNPSSIKKIIKRVTGHKMNAVYASNPIISKVSAYTEHAQHYIGRSTLLFYWGVENNAVISSHYYCSRIIFPLSLMLAQSQRNKFSEKFKYIFANDDLSNIIDKVSIDLDNYLQDLSTILGDSRYIFGEFPSTLDLYICSEFALAKRINYPNKQLINIINKHRNFSNYLDRFLNKHCPYKGFGDNTAKDTVRSDDRASPLLLFAAGATVIAAMTSFAIMNGIIRTK